MITWNIRSLELQLLYTWKISRNASDSKTNLFVTAQDGSFTGQGEAAPNIRYQESPEGLMAEFEKFRQAADAGIQNENHLQEIVRTLQLSYALRFAIESAYQHLEAARKRNSICQHLEISAPETILTSYTIPIMDPAAIKTFYNKHRLHRFPYLKLKTGKDEPLEAIRYLSSFCDQPILLDPNEAFHDVEECIYFLEKLKKFKIELVEQPLPAGLDEEYRHLKKHSPYPVFLDESIHHEADFGQLAAMGHGVNIKLMKAGSYRNAIFLLREAKRIGMSTMIGCMVETSLAISCGMRLTSLCDYADLDSFLLVRNEPFGLIKEEEGRLYFTA